MFLLVLESRNQYLAFGGGLPSEARRGRGDSFDCFENMRELGTMGKSTTNKYDVVFVIV